MLFWVPRGIFVPCSYAGRSTARVASASTWWTKVVVDSRSSRPSARRPRPMRPTCWRTRPDSISVSRPASWRACSVILARTVSTSLLPGCITPRYRLRVRNLSSGPCTTGSGMTQLTMNFSATWSSVVCSIPAASCGQLITCSAILESDMTLHRYIAFWISYAFLN